MHTFRDVIIGRSVPLSTDQDYTERKLPDALKLACEKLPVLPIYYGLDHEDVDTHGKYHDAIGRVLNLHYDPSRLAVVGDVEYDVLPEEMIRNGKVNYSLRYTYEDVKEIGPNAIGLDWLMFKHVLATTHPADWKTGHLLTPNGYLRGEEMPVTPPATPPPDPFKSVSRPLSGSETAMPDQTPEPEPKKAPEDPQPLSPSPSISPEPSMPPTLDEDIHREMITDYREKLKGTIPDAALNALTLKALRASYKEVQAKEAEAQKQAEPEHPAPAGRQGLPKPYAPAATEHAEMIQTEEGQYWTVPGFVEKMQGMFTKAFGDQPFIPVTGPVGQYGNVTADKKRK